MAKSNGKKNKKHFKLRNAVRPPRPKAEPGTESVVALEAKKLSQGEAFGYTVGGALITATGCAFLSRYLMPGVLSAGIATAIGGTAVAVARDPRARAVGQGMLAAGGAQVLLVAVDNHYQESRPKPATTVAKKPSNAPPPPPDDALVSAFERARHRVALLEANQRAA